MQWIFILITEMLIASIICCP